eukprot:1790191-Heterocapsa_arctica.AAC.1
MVLSARLRQQLRSCVAAADWSARRLLPPSLGEGVETRLGLGSTLLASHANLIGPAGGKP